MAAAELPEMPNGPVMELHGQRKRFHVPHGLKPLLEEMTLEILRYQPDDIFAFCAQYADAKLASQKTEEKKTERKSWEHSDRKYAADGPSNLNDDELQEFLDEYNIPKETADKYATKIQAAFRGHIARKSLTEHGKVLHKDHRKSWEWKRWSWEGSSALTEEQLNEFLDEYHVSYAIANKQATKIQAAYRGHAVRRSLGDAGVEGVRKASLKAEEEASSVEGPSSDEEEEGGQGSLWPSKSKVKSPSKTGIRKARKSAGSPGSPGNLSEPSDDEDNEEGLEKSDEIMDAEEGGLSDSEPEEQPETENEDQALPEVESTVVEGEEEDEGGAL